MQQLEQTLVILKPDAVQRRLVGAILQRFEQKGLAVVGLKLMRISPELAATHYQDHKGKYFHEPLLKYVTSGPVVVMVLTGKGAIAIVRAMMGPTFGPDAPPGTIRGDLGVSKRFNLVHGSDSAEAARREISLYFQPGEILDYTPADFSWLYDTTGPELI